MEKSQVIPPLSLKSEGLLWQEVHCKFHLKAYFCQASAALKGKPHGRRLQCSGHVSFGFCLGLDGL